MWLHSSKWRDRVHGLVLATGCTLAITAAARGGTLLVDDGAPPGGDGLNWPTAYRFLQDALADATEGDDIRVAQGVYLPDRDEANPDGTGDRTAAFQLVNGVIVRGGYAGLGAGDPDERDVSLYETILSGDLLGDDGPGHQGNRTENSFHVVVGSGTDDTAVLDGFTVTAGGGVEPDGLEPGGGMLNVSGHPVVIACTFLHNFATLGGGMYNEESSPTVTECRFIGNQTAYFGGRGGGMYNTASAPVVTGCLFAGNGSNGAGVANEDASGAILVNCIFSCNSGGSYAVAGVLNADSSPTMANCLFAGNFGPEIVSFRGPGDPVVVNCTIVRNHSEIAIYAGGPGASVSNCIVWDADWRQIDGDPRITVRFSCIEGSYPGQRVIGTDPGFAVGPAGTWTEESTFDRDLHQTTFTDANASFTPGALVGKFVETDYGAQLIIANTATTMTIWGWMGAVSEDPYEVIDLHLPPGSPCIDAATNEAAYGMTTDLDGAARFVNDPTTADTGCGPCPVIDMGAFEFQDGVTDCCPADLDDSGFVGFGDVLAILTAWGPCEACPEDLDGSGSVDFGDILMVLTAWGPCTSTPLAGACCLTDGQCIQIDEETCETMGGVFDGQCTLCEEALCVGSCGTVITAPRVVFGESCSESDDCSQYECDCYAEDCGDSRDARFEVVIPTDGTWRFSTCGDTGYDTVLTVGTTCCSADLACNDDFLDCEGNPFSVSSEVSLDLVAGTYFVIIEGFSPDDCGTYTLTVEPAGSH